MLVAIGRADAEVSLVLCDDDTIHELNREHRGVDRPTDVLSFALHEGEHGDVAGPMLGDLVISLSTAARQARERGRSEADEQRFLLAHGLLHLLGVDHPDEGSLRRMLALGDALASAGRNRAIRTDRP